MFPVPFLMLLAIFTMRPHVTSRATVAQPSSERMQYPLLSQSSPSGALDTMVTVKSPGRSRRFASRARVLEVLAVADGSMARRHGGELRQYLLSLLGETARVYQHPSLGTSLRLSLVKVQGRLNSWMFFFIFLTNT